MDAYTLCRLLGRWDHPDQMLEELTLPQYDGWLCYLRHYNLFPDRDDILWGLLTASVINQWTGKGEGVRPCEVMPYFDQFAEEISEEELARRIMAAID